MNVLKFRLSALVLGFSIALILSCASSDNLISRDSTDALKNGARNVRSDTVYFILDNSGSMADRINNRNNQVKAAAAKKILYRFNRIFPDDMNAALRSYGENYFRLEYTELHYGISKFCCWDFGKAVRDLGVPRGTGNLENALTATGEDLKSRPGRIALVILSDGKGITGDPVAAAAVLKVKLGNRLCINTIQLGNDKKGAEILSRVTSAGQCGTAVNYDNLQTGDSIKAFFRGLFPAAKKVEQSKPEKAISSEEKKAAPESKPEITYRYKKKVKPGKVFLRLQVRFDNGKADIRREYADEIKKVADFMKQYPETKVAIEGHTDSLGAYSMNMRLSRQRADAVIQELVEKHGIDISRIKAVGYGPQRPIASNATEKGREKNRRVEARRISN